MLRTPEGVERYNREQAARFDWAGFLVFCAVTTLAFGYGGVVWGVAVTLLLVLLYVDVTFPEER